MMKISKQSILISAIALISISSATNCIAAKPREEKMIPYGENHGLWVPFEDDTKDRSLDTYDKAIDDYNARGDELQEEWESKVNKFLKSNKEKVMSMYRTLSHTGLIVVQNSNVSDSDKSKSDKSSTTNKVKFMVSASTEYITMETDDWKVLYYPRQDDFLLLSFNRITAEKFEQVFNDMVTATGNTLISYINEIKKDMAKLK